MTIKHISSATGIRYLIVVLIAATAITMVSVTLTYHSALQGSEDSLKLTAMGIAVGLEATLSRTEKGRESLFNEMISEGSWEGIAFIALCDDEGRTLLHSNKHLINRRLPDSQITAVSGKGTPLHDYATLGTGERVFILYFPVHLAEGRAVLKLALHTYPAEKIIREARTQVALISFITLALWLTAFFFIRGIKRSEKMEKLIAEREQLAVLGEMASTLAHEIRNPLGSIKGFAQYVLDQDQLKNRDHLNIIVAESQRLEVLTEDLLRYARPDNVTTTVFKLPELVDEVVQLANIAGPSANGIRWTIDIAGGLTLKTDRDKLKQVLINILDNSRNAPGEQAGSETAISISADAPDRRNIRITIEDNGPGMDPRTRDDAFQPFFTTKTKGTGLGLAIVEKLVRALGGSVELWSEKGRGTAVRITLPKEIT